MQVNNKQNLSELTEIKFLIQNKHNASLLQRWSS